MPQKIGIFGVPTKGINLIIPLRSFHLTIASTPRPSTNIATGPTHPPYRKNITCFLAKTTP